MEILCSKEEKEKLFVIFEGVAYSSHNCTLAYISSLIEILSDNTLWNTTQQSGEQQISETNHVQTNFGNRCSTLHFSYVSHRKHVKHLIILVCANLLECNRLFRRMCFLKNNMKNRLLVQLSRVQLNSMEMGLSDPSRVQKSLEYKS